MLKCCKKLTKTEMRELLLSATPDVSKPHPEVVRACALALKQRGLSAQISFNIQVMKQRHSISSPHPATVPPNRSPKPRAPSTTFSTPTKPADPFPPPNYRTARNPVPSASPRKRELQTDQRQATPSLHTLKA